MFLLYCLQHAFCDLCVEYLKGKKIGQAFVKAIMKDYEDIPGSNGTMRVLRNVVSLEGTGEADVILRNITETFWQAVIDATEEYRVCAVGTPGIGKTTTTCILIRLLLKQKKTVVYRVLGTDAHGYVFMFIPPPNDSTKIVVKVIKENEFDYHDENVNNDSIYYVVDPGKTKDKNCDLDSDYRGKVIIIASPDEGHWGLGEFTKKRLRVKGTFRYYPIWSLIELLYARRFFDVNLDVEVICNRYEEVGGIPRLVFTSEDEYNAVLILQENAINRLSDEQVRLLTLNDAHAAQTFGSNQPKSIIMVYNCVGMNFKEFSMTVSSQRVVRLLVTKKMHLLWNLILKSDSSSSTATWQVFEVYCQNLMLGDAAKKFYDYKYHDGIGLLDARHVGHELLLGGCSKIIGTQQSLIAATKREESEKVVFYSLDPGNKFIDFVYRVDSTIYAFQVTIGKVHSCNSNHFKKALEETGNDFKFLLHYLTYQNQYESFQLLPANPFSNGNTIPVKQSDVWTLKVIRVPAPNEDHRGPTLSPHLNGLTVRQLKAKIKGMDRTLSTKGKKDDLIQRIREYEMSNEQI